MAVARASRFRRRARARRASRVPSRAQRRASSPRPPAGAILLYRSALRRLASEFAAIVNDVLGDVLHHVAHGDSWRTDAVGASELRRRLASAIASRLDLSHLERLTGEVATRTERRAQQEVARLVPRLTLRSQIPGGDLGIVLKWRRDNVDLVRSLFQRQTTQLEYVLNNNEFLRVEDLADRIQQVLGVTEDKADLLARDQTLRLSSQVTIAKQQAAGVSKFIWSTSGDERVRESHEELDGQTFSFDDPPVVDGEAILPGQAYGCLPGHAQVSFRDVVRAYRRPWAGHLTVLVAGGIALETTPNHPVLTQRGWVPAHLVEVGDQLVRVGGYRVDDAKLLAASSGAAREEHDENRQPEISEVFDALQVLWDAEVSVGSAIEFHGDGLVDEQVNAVASEGGLLPHAEAPLSEGFRQLVLKEADRLSPAQLLRSSLFYRVLRRQLPAGDEDLHRACHLLALFEAHLLEPEKVRFPLSSDTLAKLAEHGGNAPSGRGEGPGDFQDAASLPIEAKKLLIRKVLGLALGADRPAEPVPSEGLGELGRADAVVLGDLAQGGSLRDLLVRVDEKRERMFDGHVYNLETRTGWFSGPGLFTVHNCRCTPYPVVTLLDDPDLDE